MSTSKKQMTSSKMARYTFIVIFSFMLQSCIGALGDALFGGGNGNGNDLAAKINAALTCTEDALSPGPAPIRRLSPNEYINSINSIFQVDASSQLAALPVDSTSSQFNNNAEWLTITRDHALAYMSIAQFVSNEVLASTEARQVVLQGCDPLNETCLSSLIQRLGRRVFRRDLDSEELASINALVAFGQSPDEKAALLIEGLIQAPQFLFRAELGNETSSRQNLLSLTSFELASRLSFTLLQTSPSEALLDAAAEGQFDESNPDAVNNIKSWAETLIADSSAQDAMRSFTHQWFGLDLLDKYNSEHPDYSAELAVAARTELSMLIDDYYWNDASFMDLYTSSYGYVEQNLAGIYEITQASSAHQKTNIAADTGRGGLFGTVGFSMLTTFGSDNTIVHRGVYVRQVALCDEPPPPPPDAEAALAAPGQNPLDVVDARADNAVCSACHVKIDGIGLGLEQFDSIGKVRSEYTTGANTYALPDGGYVDVDGDEAEDFKGAAELGQIVAASEMAADCAAEHYIEWGLGRSVHPTADPCTISAMRSLMKESNYNFRKLVSSFVASDAFRYRIPHD